MRRREFIGLLGGAAAWPVAARAQQQPTMPVIGFLHYGSAKAYGHTVSAVRQGLRESGFIEGQNLAVEYRWAEGQYGRLPTLAGELVQRQVFAIVAAGVVAAEAAKAATTTIPIVFETGADPIQLGLVASLSRPGGSVTGVTQLNWEVIPKGLDLLHELLPTAGVMALLVNPTDPANAEFQSRVVLALQAPCRQRQHGARFRYGFRRPDAFAGRRARDWWRCILQ